MAPPKPPLLRKTGALLVLATGAILAIGGAWVQRHDEQAERRVVEGRAAAFAEALEHSVVEAMTQNRREMIPAVFAAVARTESVVGVALTGPSGVVRFSSGTVPAHPPPGPARAWSERQLVLVEPIHATEPCRGCHGDRKSHGAMVVVLDTGAIAPRLSALARWKVALAALAFAAVAVTALLAQRIQHRNAELRRALAAANEAREARAADLGRLQAILDAMVDGVVFVDAEDRVAMFNAAGRVLRNLTEGPGRSLRDCHPKATHAMLDRVMRYLRDGDDAGPAHSIIKERGGRLETTYAPVRGEGGAYLGTVMVIRDISERRTLERRLLDAERLAGLGQMSAQIAHDLRNPLNAIAGAAQYLRRRVAADGEVAEYAGLIDGEVQRVNRFVEALLHVARPAEPVFAPVAVNRLLRDAAQRAAIARGLPADAVRLELAGDLPVLDVDAAMLGEAIENLIANAFEAGGSAPVELASRYAAEGGEGTIVVEVRDRGCGIPPADLEEVLRPFVTTKPTGTGLGLVVVTRAVDQHRARFSLAAREGGGTVASLRFPVRRRAPAPDPEVA